MKFWKYQANGNDFILTETKPVAIQTVCDRHFGIGADGVLVGKERDGGVSYQHFNADGSAAAFCGNGIRCLASWYMERHAIKRCEVEINGKTYPVYREGDDVILKMPLPEWIGGGRYRVGVMHAVGFEPFVDERCNVDIITGISNHTLEVSTTELGVGKTLSCGSGNIAAFYHARRMGYVDDRVTCVNPGGVSRLWYQNSHIYYASRVACVFNGAYGDETEGLDR